MSQRDIYSHKSIASLDVANFRGLRKDETMKTRYKFIHFNENGRGQWLCYNNRTGDVLGIVRQGAWKKLMFQPQSFTEFSQDCHLDIAHFMGQLNPDGSPKTSPAEHEPNTRPSDPSLFARPDRNSKGEPIAPDLQKPRTSGNTEPKPQSTSEVLGVIRKCKRYRNDG
jgi:hypothetical protein